MKIIKNDSFVADLKCPAIAMLKSVVAEFNCIEEVAVFETIHGHIAELKKKEGRYIPCRENTPERLDIDSLVFLSRLKGFRWVEAMHGGLSIGFENIN